MSGGGGGGDMSMMMLPLVMMASGIMGRTQGGPAGGGQGPLSQAGSMANQGLSAMGMSGNPAQSQQSFTPWNQVPPQMQQQVNSALAQNPSTAALQGQVAAVDPVNGAGGSGGGAMGSAGGGMNPAMMAGLGQVGAQYMDYLNQRRLLQMQQQTRYAPPSQSAAGQMPPSLGFLPHQSFALPQIG